MRGVGDDPADREARAEFLELVGIASGLHPDQGITTGDGEDAEVKRAVIARSGTAILLASSEKIGAVASFEIAPWSQIDGIVVANVLAQKARATFGGLGCAIHSGDP